jgi:hypothetical protein
MGEIYAIESDHYNLLATPTGSTDTSLGPKLNKVVVSN